MQAIEGKLRALGVRWLRDLAYVEDVRAETDMNVVVTGRGLFVEVQGTAEGAPFDKRELDALLELGLSGCATLRDIQTDTLASGE